MEKVSGCRLTPEPLCLGFFDENFDLVFLTTRGLLLPGLGGIFSSKISMISLEKKKAAVQVGYPENQELLFRFTLRVPVKPRRNGDIPACCAAVNIKQRTA